MSRVVNLELPDRVFSRLAGLAQAAGQTPEEWILQRVRTALPDEDERKRALARLLSHGGAMSTGQPLGTDNEAIDRELAEEAGGSHETSP